MSVLGDLKKKINDKSVVIFYPSDSVRISEFDEQMFVPVDENSIILKTETLKKLIDVTKAANLLVQEMKIRPFSPDTWVISGLKQTLKELEDVK